MTLAAGTTLGSYQIVSAIGAGGMGEVYRARDTKLHRDVAVKVLPEAFALDPERLTRFEREARVLASLNHPNIAQIYDDTLFMATHIDSTPVFQYSPPRKLFDGIFNLRAESGVSFDVDSAGKRFLMIRLTGEGAAPGSIRVITGWTQKLERLMTK